MLPKIAVISFDHWNYDVHIVNALQEKGIESFHIKIGDFKYKNKWERVKNSLSKIFLGKNPKLKKRQDYILNQLQEKGFQDQILVINPELIDLEYHLKIKKHTKKYIAYLYDSVSRCPVEHLLDGIFDEIYSFDKNDISTYGFSATSNYIYFKLEENTQKTTNDFVYIGSIDNRVNHLNAIAQKLKDEGKTYTFYAIGKKAFVCQLKQFFLGENKHITFRKNRFNQSETLDIYRNSNVIIDLVRENQTGLSFRVFEAMGLQKNVITNNKSISTYDISDSGKIVYLDDLLKINNVSFNEGNYPNELREKYHINNWIQTVFKV
ncbi:hypothetical protein [Flavobacterium facile]|uniref:hypothetical protein n=1 Tax=Flavobacterium facile TaxID=2893174 RepID=UPI002E792219|nr:hypothetical protein [Flavobacterium sp. T-12]